ncbi:toll/interleukin-1 receptor domain-containing protein [Streptomyces sp. NPDC003077]|uniref:toll/interleukin-1 receptor domain-containing protein n=1 Tax=Streptomyces sp. NPDC003077 TaxID=3154443 RepID=UPI0033AE8650
MPDIFINYRTGDSEEGAVLIAHELSRRFGEEQVFLASSSIKAGDAFPSELLANLRRSSVVLVVIGPRWLEIRDKRGRRALDRTDDWTRREILEAFSCGIRVIPVLVGRETPRLSPALLPAPLAGLADRQYRRLDTRASKANLADLGDVLAELVPRLADLDRGRADEPTPGTSGDSRNSISDQHGTAIQAHDYTNRQSGGIGNVTGDLGTYINDARGNWHTGSGRQQNFSGNSSNTEGDSHGDNGQWFGTRRPPEDDE